MEIIPKAGALPYRRLESGEIEILIISRQDSDHWILPMGKIDPGETPEETAKREAQEEAGVEVQPEEFIGVLSFIDKSGLKQEVAFYMAEYIGDAEWPEQHLRRRSWIALNQAEKVIAPDFITFVRTARNLIGPMAKE